MPQIIPGWVHSPGKHCASTVLADVSKFYGLEMTEAFALGLGAGLGFFYMQGEQLNPSRMIMTRSQDLEGNFFRSLSLAFAWKNESEPDQGWDAVKNFIDQKIPVLLRADIYHLDHYQSKTHFPLHVIMLWGYDEQEKTAFIADTGWEGLLEIPLTSLSKARYSQVPFYRGSGEYFPVVMPSKLKDLEARTAEAVKLQARELENTGAWAAMRKVAEDLEQWPEQKDASWCFRWAYQIIERRGTGGGAFRKIYAEFLREAGKMFPAIAEYAPAEEMEAIGQSWSELSRLLKELSEQAQVQKVVLGRAARLFAELAEREQCFFEHAREKL